MSSRRTRRNTPPNVHVQYAGGALVDVDILTAMKAGHIIIEPFDKDCLGTNSYDVRLSKHLAIYEREVTPDGYDVLPLDVAKPPQVKHFDIPDEGFVLKPGELYLGSTIEYTESHRHIPIINGKSSLGRLGLFVHVTAGTGDIGFCNHWTLEMVVVHPLRIYAGMKIAQLLWHVPSAEPAVRYIKKPGAKYTKRDPKPQPSEYWRNLLPSELLKDLAK